jgi:allantoicase
MGGCALESDIKRIDCETKEWVKVIEKELKPGYPETRYNIFPIETKNTRFIRLNIFPDGGIARFKAFGVIKKELKGLCDIACVENGARAIEWSNAHYGTPMCLLSKLKSTGMHDGWETARNPNRPRIYTVTNGLLNMVGADWCIIELACKGRVEKIIVDTNHYKGNSPESVMIEYYDGQWKVLLERVKVKPHQEHEFVVNGVVADKVKLTMFPDGGVSRLRIFAQVDS